MFQGGVPQVRGEVIKYSDFRGYGFIRANSTDYFVHVSQIGMDGFKTLSPGQIVEFEAVHTNKGLQARDVHIVSTDSEPQATADKLVLKRNPFTPQDPVIDPEKFAGRKEPFRNAMDAIYNSKNVLITGPRGIGKSSMSYQLLYLTQGDTTLLSRLDIDVGDFRFAHVSGDHRCVPGNDLQDIAYGLVSTLRANLGAGKKTTKSTSSLGIDLKVVSAKVEETEEFSSPTELSTWFVSEVEALYRSVDHAARGVTFLIDEVDVLQDKVQIAPFLKAAVEKFRLDGFDNTSFIVSGVTGTVTNMISQHQSAGRLFEMLELQRMTDEETEELILIALEGTGVGITSGASSRILSLSNRFPQPVQLLGYHSFRLDTDKSIDRDDVDRAVEFVVQSLRRQEFENKLETLGRGVIRDILRVFASSKLDTVELGHVTSHTGISIDEIAGNLGNLEKWGIVEKQHRGVYRLREPLFKIYLRWVFGIEAGPAGRNGS